MILLFKDVRIINFIVFNFVKNLLDVIVFFINKKGDFKNEIYWI